MPDTGMPLSLESSKQPNEGSEGHRPGGDGPPPSAAHLPTPPTGTVRRAVCGTESGQEDKKDQTESGRYISSSYKRDLYPGGGTRRGGAKLLSAQPLLVGSGRGVAYLNHPSFPIGGG